AQKYNVSVKTLYSWAKILKTDNAVSVSPDAKSKFVLRFHSSAFSVDALKWALSWRLNNPLSSIIQAYEKLQEQAQNENWKIGNYQSFARLINTDEIKILLKRAIGGKREIYNDVAPYVMRDLDKYAALEVVVGDQIVFDYLVYNDQGEIVNPNAYIWVDMSTSAIIGVDITLGKYNRYSVGRSLKMALNYGVPQTIYTDNGKPELSKYLADVRAQLSGIRWRDIDDLEPTLRHQKARPRNSRAKPIEGIFNHVQRRLFEDVAAEFGGFGYQKYTKTNRDEWVKNIQKAALKNSALMDWRYFIGKVAKAIDWWNSHLIQERKIVPIEAFNERLKVANVSRFDQDTLNYIFMPRKLCSVRNSSIRLTIAGERRTYSHPALARFFDQKVEVRFSEGDVTSVAISTEDHKFVCNANLVEKIDPREAEELKAALAQQNAVANAIEEEFRKYSSIYKPSYQINAYTAPAQAANQQIKEEKRISKKYEMSDRELIAAMKPKQARA
ncbi:MAG: Mu transposase C-terminal domain-containing protein, partial [Helicobacteraceae bacterium]|nr:Mu transposase C-terminal domain-containing protein [Helicobacteraceae bacterium]